MSIPALRDYDIGEPLAQRVVADVADHVSEALVDFDTEPIPAGCTLGPGLPVRSGPRPPRRDDIAELAFFVQECPAEFAALTGLRPRAGLDPSRNPMRVVAAYLRAGHRLVECHPWSKVAIGRYTGKRAVALILDEADLMRRLAERPDMNVALLIPGDMVVVDPDSDPASERLGSLRVGWTQARRGAHAGFLRPGGLRLRSAQGTGQFASCDLKANGYVMVAPSQVVQFHRTVHGGEFATFWRYTEDPEWSQTGYSTCCLPMMPKDLLVQMSARTAAPAFRARDRSSSPLGGQEAARLRRRPWLAERRDGHRHQAIRRVLLQAQGLGRGMTEVLAEVMASPVSSKITEKGAAGPAWLRRQWDQAVAVHDPSRRLRGSAPYWEGTKVGAWRRQVRRAKLTHNERTVLQAHSDHALRHGLDYYLAYSTLSTSTGLNTGTLHRTVRALVRKGWLVARRGPVDNPLGSRQAHYWHLAREGRPLLPTTGNGTACIGDVRQPGRKTVLLSCRWPRAVPWSTPADHRVLVRWLIQTSARSTNRARSPPSSREGSGPLPRNGERCGLLVHPAPSPWPGRGRSPACRAPSPGQWRCADDHLRTTGSDHLDGIAGGHPHRRPDARRRERDGEVDEVEGRGRPPRRALRRDLHAGRRPSSATSLSRLRTGVRPAHRRRSGRRRRPAPPAGLITRTAGGERWWIPVPLPTSRHNGGNSPSERRKRDHESRLFSLVGRGSARARPGPIQSGACRLIEEP